MNAIISNGDYTASVQLPVERRQLAGALAYLGATHASEYDIKYNEESNKGLSFTLDCRGIVFKQSQQRQIYRQGLRY